MTRISKLGTTLALTSNPSTLQSPSWKVTPQHSGSCMWPSFCFTVTPAIPCTFLGTLVLSHKAQR
jgi:hypothetical protein